MLIFAHLWKSYPFPGSIAINAFLQASLLWIELVLFHITSPSAHPSVGDGWGEGCYFFCNILVVSSHCMIIPRKTGLGDRFGGCFDHCIAPELVVSKSVFPCLALNPSKHLNIGCWPSLLLCST